MKSNQYLLNRNIGNKTIGEYLYEKSKQLKPHPIQPPSIPHPTPKSITLYNKQKITAFRYLFALMDSDGDGTISGTSIEIEGLGEDVLRLMTPLLV